jgi:cytochrome c-type biogenesis protein CcmH
MIRALFLALTVLLVGTAFDLGTTPTAAADPTLRTADQPLADPALEARARALMREIRCVVCQSESIDESDADIAANLRNIVREQIAAGKSEAEIRDYLTARYGDFVLLKPPFNRSTFVLWLSPFVLALIALGAGFVTLRRSRSTDNAKATRDLSGAERERLKQLLVEDGDGSRP